MLAHGARHCVASCKALQLFTGAFLSLFAGALLHLFTGAFLDLFTGALLHLFTGAFLHFFTGAWLLCALRIFLKKVFIFMNVHFHVQMYVKMDKKKRSAHRLFEHFHVRKECAFSRAKRVCIFMHRLRVCAAVRIF